MKWEYKPFNELNIKQLYNILQLRNEVFVVEQNCIYQDADGKDFNAIHIFLTDKDKIVAYTRVFKSGNYFSNASIGRVVVNPIFRNKNFGKKIMLKSLDYVLKVLQENTIEISAQTYLDKFYRDLGFIPFGKEYLEDGLPHIRMIYKK